MQHILLKLSRIKNAQVTHVFNYSVISEMIQMRSTDTDKLIDPRVRNVKDKLLYSDYIQSKQLKFGFRENWIVKKKLEYRFQKEDRESTNLSSLSIALKYYDKERADLSEKLSSSDESEEGEELCEESVSKDKPIHMPYASIDKYSKVPIPTQNLKQEESDIPEPKLQEKYKVLYEKYLEVSKYSITNPDKFASDFIKSKLKIRLDDDYSKVPASWMTDYEIYDDGLQEEFEDVKYGTPDPNSEVSAVPCGGCGSLLHCKDVAIPGYLPSEIFLNCTETDLQSVICQRCHFMKNYNTCLDVKVSADEYPKLLEQIKTKGSIAILLVDLTDFPCSIWPQLPSIIGENKHLYVVGNKIDLLPKDSPQFFQHVKHCLTESLIETGIVKSNIKYIGLISAKTGYGIEELINKLHKLWKNRGDVYLIGCTNSGKSTLFNTLLQSDFCKSQAVDLVQRATTSPWPGTTLNLLKFPILNARYRKLYLRTMRLKEENKLNALDEKLRLQELKKSKNIELATLQSRISHTFKTTSDINKAINQANISDIVTINKPTTFGLDETADEYKNARWCYDTPGTIQPDQILHFLTTDELMMTLPNKIISPRTFCMWAGQSIFIAGLGRLDILNVPNFIRCTVFASNKLPITICETQYADDIYNELLHSEAFVVPVNNPDRLKMWPEFNSKDLETVGLGKDESASDVVLSSSGWIAITAMEGDTVSMKGWTPEGRGIYLRTPALLPKSVTLRGMRKVGSPAYHLGRQVYRSQRVNVLFNKKI